MAEKPHFSEAFQISFHTPEKDVIRYISDLWRVGGYFNSRTHEGCDQL